MVCQDRWSIMAVVSQNRFHCILHQRMISSIFLGMLLSKMRANIKESVYNSCGKVTSFPTVAERIVNVFVKCKIKKAH